MIAAITGFISGIFGPLFSALASYFGTKRHDRKLEELGNAKAELRNARAAAAEVAEAASARAAMADSLRDDDSVRKPDKHQRPD